MAGYAKRRGAPLVTGTRAPVLVSAVPAVAALVLLAVTAWCRLQRAEVHGTSMVPALIPGDRLVVWKGTARMRAGNIVAATDPRQPERQVLKRVAAVGPEGVTLLGDNPDASTDSRELGPFPLACIRGRAVYRYYPPQRAGRLP